MSEDVDKALEAAVSAIYFGDSADYGTALWEVVKALDEEVAEGLQKNPRETFHEVRERLRGE